ncbi:MAG: hypothetical protein LAT76_00860 [Schleiferiaceae bacterium]|nr:hypothetical protein [Schleiferiaceae bacterium]
MKISKLTAFLTLAFVSSAAVYAQPFNPSDPVPLDGGLTLLLTAGAVYGAKKAYDKYKENTI